MSSSAPAPSRLGWLVPWGTRASGRFLAAAPAGAVVDVQRNEVFSAELGHGVVAQEHGPGDRRPSREGALGRVVARDANVASQPFLSRQEVLPARASR